MKKAFIPKSSDAVISCSEYCVPDKAIFAVLGKRFTISHTSDAGGIRLKVPKSNPAYGFWFPSKYIL